MKKKSMVSLSFDWKTLSVKRFAFLLFFCCSSIHGLIQSLQLMEYYFINFRPCVYQTFSLPFPLDISPYLKWITFQLAFSIFLEFFFSVFVSMKIVYSVSFGKSFSKKHIDNDIDTLVNCFRLCKSIILLPGMILLFFPSTHRRWTIFSWIKYLAEWILEFQIEWIREWMLVSPWRAKINIKKIYLDWAKRKHTHTHTRRQNKCLEQFFFSSLENSKKKNVVHATF